MIPVRWLAVAAVVLAVFRIGLNVVDSQVIDIGFANVVGADRIADGDGVYDGQFTPLIDRGDSYGPLSYLSYVPFEQLLPVGRRPRAAARRPRWRRSSSTSRSSALLLLAGRRLRDGREGRDLGIALAFAWLAYPYTLYALDANGGNDALVAALLVAALIAFASPRRARARDRARRGDEVRPARAGAAVRGRPGRAADPLDADLRRPSSSPSGPWCCCRCCPTAASASSTTGRSATRRRAGRRSASGGSSRRSAALQDVARAFPVLLGIAALLPARAPDGAAGRRARRRGADRDPGRLDPLVLLLHPLVDAVRARSTPSRPRSGSRVGDPGVRMSISSASRSSLP